MIKMQTFNIVFSQNYSLITLRVHLYHSTDDIRSSVSIGDWNARLPKQQHFDIASHVMWLWWCRTMTRAAIVRPWTMVVCGEEVWRESWVWVRSYGWLRASLNGGCPRRQLNDLSLSCTGCAKNRHFFRIWVTEFPPSLDALYLQFLRTRVSLSLNDVVLRLPM